MTMTRRSFFAALVAPVVAPMVPLPKPSTGVNRFFGTQTLSISGNIDTVTFYPLMLSDAELRSTVSALVDAINKEVQRGNCRLTATEVRR